ncbi:hypothetical protein PFISCL1PPCAC_22161, partial [Pristionchus fissidentatus]
IARHNNESISFAFHIIDCFEKLGKFRPKLHIGRACVRGSIGRNTNLVVSTLKCQTVQIHIASSSGGDSSCVAVR